MTRSNKIHYLSIEERAFSFFVEAALKRKGDLLYGIDKYEILTLYTNNPKVVQEAMQGIDLKKDFHVIVSLVNENYMPKCDDNNIRMYGALYVANLAGEYIDLWWNFVATSTKSPEVKIDIVDEDLTFLYIDWTPLAVLATGIPAKIATSEIDTLSELNLNEFRSKTRDQSPTVIIGNGASVHFGSELWGDMSNYLVDLLRPLYVDNIELVKKVIGNNTFSATSIAKLFVSDTRYKNALHECIYRKYEDKMHDDYTLVRAIVKSKIVNPDINLITYNYDDFIEKDFYKVSTRTMASVCNNAEDRRSGEPKIKHVHGLMHYMKPDEAKSIVLTQEDYFNKYKSNSWTKKVQISALNGVCLFVGSSMSDLFQMSLIDSVKYKQEEGNDKVWYCYALLCLKGLSPRDKLTVYNYYLAKGIKLVFVNEFEELADKCQCLLAP